MSVDQSEFLKQKGYLVFVTPGYGLDIRQCTRSEVFGYLSDNDSEIEDFDEAMHALNSDGWHHAFYEKNEDAYAEALDGVRCHGKFYSLDQHSAYWQFQEACSKGDLSMARTILQHCGNEYEAFADGSMLESPACSGHLEIVNELLKRYKPNNLSHGFDAMNLAGANGHAHVVEELAKHFHPREESYHTFGLAAQDGHLNVVKVLLPYSDAENNSNALIEASKWGHLSIVQELLPHSDIRAHDCRALRMAAAAGHLEVVQELLPHSDHKGMNGEALRLAAFHGHLDVTQELLPHSDIESSGAFSEAIHNGHTDCAEAIRTYIAQRDKDLLIKELNVTPGLEQRKARRM